MRGPYIRERIAVSCPGLHKPMKLEAEHVRWMSLDELHCGLLLCMHIRDFPDSEKFLVLLWGIKRVQPPCPGVRDLRIISEPQLEAEV